jgi:pSer/pThr/pTyr-binding forkhead associated (FHA) protein
MATGLVIHISSGEDRHTEILSDDSIRIGTSENCDLRLRTSSLPKSTANAVLLELSRTNGSYRVTDFDSSVPLTMNGTAVSSGTEINDGDELRIADSELVLHFFPVRALPAVVPGAPRETHVAPFIEAAAARKPVLRWKQRDESASSATQS